MRRPLANTVGLSAILLLPSLSPAQAREADAAERTFLRKQADVLHDWAKRAFKAGYPAMARPVWLEVLADYDGDHADSRAALGFQKFGTSWAPKPGFSYREGDNPDAGAGKRIARAWESAAKALAQAHKAEAQRLSGAGKAARAQFHWRKVARFDTADPDVQAALGLKPVGNSYGSAVEEQLFARSKMMKGLIEELLRKEIASQPLDAAKVPGIVKKAGFEGFVGFKSEHFEMWGNLEPEVLQRAAGHAERALQFCEKVLVGHMRFRTANVKVRTYVFCKTRAEYVKLLQANKDSFRDQSRFEFLLKNRAITRIAGIQSGPAQQPQNAYDAAVRYVVHQYSNLRSDALREGIGHAVVGKFFGVNLAFTIAQATGTVTDRQRRLRLPDIDTWRELAEEAAFDPKGTKAARLPLLSAADFPDDGRIKAWSFCDYLLRRDPKLLLDLDNQRRVKVEREVEAGFTSAAKVSLAELEQEWKDFWTGATPVLAALRNKHSSLAAMSSGAKKVLRAFNKARKDLGLPEVSWSGAYSVACKQHLEYVKGYKAEPPPFWQVQDPEDPKGTVAGSAFASNALISVKGTGGMRKWLDIPGYRDALLNPRLRMVGIYAEGSLLVMDVARGVDSVQRVQAAVYPRHNSKGVSRSHSMKLVGVDLISRLEAMGEKPGRTIGYPITLHGFGGAQGDVQVVCTAGGERVEGVTIIGARTRLDGGPGMVTFYPLKPLPSGTIEVRFQRAGGKQAGGTRFQAR